MQFSLRSILIAMAVVAVYLSLVTNYLVYGTNGADFASRIAVVPLVVAFVGVSADVILSSHSSFARALILGGALAIAANIALMAESIGIGYWSFRDDPPEYLIHATRHAGLGALLGMAPVLTKKALAWSLRRRRAARGQHPGNTPQCPASAHD